MKVREGKEKKCKKSWRREGGRKRKKEERDNVASLLLFYRIRESKKESSPCSQSL